MKTYTPKRVTPVIRKFCNEISPSTSPAYIKCTPEPGAKALECFETVDVYQRKNKGKAIYGWAIWERIPIMIEAEFHCIWESPNGMRFDLTPRTQSCDQILFLEDPNRRYEGFQVNNIRRPLREDPLIDSFIVIHDRIFEAQNRGSLKFKHGAIPMTMELEHYMRSALAIENQLIKRYTKR